MQWKTMAPKLSIAKIFARTNKTHTHTHTHKIYIFIAKINCNARSECPFLFPVSRHIFGGQFGSRYAEKSNDKSVMQHQHVRHCWSLFRIIHSGTESWAASSESSFFLVAMERRVEIPLLRCNASGHPYIPTLLRAIRKTHTHERKPKH
jgi:hypothetical protein